jgi:ribulose kinase
LRFARVIGASSLSSSSFRIVVAVDGGTESIRACCFDEGGNIVGRPCAIPYKTTHPFNAWAEQDPNDWYNCLGEAVRGALDSILPSGRGQVRAICIDTTCCSVVAMDQDGTPIRPSLLWMDARSANETTAIMDQCRGDPALKVNCDGHGPLSAEWLLPKALWIRNHEPDIWERATMIGEYQDYINYKLTGGIFCASSCNAATRWHWDGNEALKKNGDKNKHPGRPLSLYKSLGIPELAAKLPQTCYAMGEIIGPLCREAAEHLSLPEGLPVVQVSLTFNLREIELLLFVTIFSSFCSTHNCLNNKPTLTLD